MSDDIIEKTLVKPRKTWSKKADLATKIVNLDKLSRKIKTVLARQVDRLMIASHAGLLDKDQLAALSLCQKLLSDYTKQEREMLAALPEDELDAIATKQDR